MRKMRFKNTKKAAKVANTGARLSSRIAHVSFGKKMPNEIKLVGLLLLMFAALYVFQLISTPSFLKSQAGGITGLVVSDTINKNEPVTTTAPVATASQPPAQPQTKAAAASPTTPIKIISPPKGSVQSTGFSINTEVSEQVLTCYYRVDDNGQLAWDRRTKPCKTTIYVAPDYCKTVGKNTCYVYAEAADSNGNIIGTDTAYYSIQ